jgi:hypothetical protein
MKAMILNGLGFLSALFAITLDSRTTSRLQQYLDFFKTKWW